jgi:hypothetical protein
VPSGVVFGAPLQSRAQLPLGTRKVALAQSVQMLRAGNTSQKKQSGPQAHGVPSLSTVPPLQISGSASVVVVGVVVVAVVVVAALLVMESVDSVVKLVEGDGPATVVVVVRGRITVSWMLSTLACPLVPTARIEMTTPSPPADGCVTTSENWTVCNAPATSWSDVMVRSVSSKLVVPVVTCRMRSGKLLMSKRRPTTAVTTKVSPTATV